MSEPLWLVPVEDELFTVDNMFAKYLMVARRVVLIGICSVLTFLHALLYLIGIGAMMLCSWAPYLLSRQIFSKNIKELDSMFFAWVIVAIIIACFIAPSWERIWQSFDPSTTRLFEIMRDSSPIPQPAVQSAIVSADNYLYNVENYYSDTRPEENKQLNATYELGKQYEKKRDYDRMIKVYELALKCRHAPSLYRLLQYCTHARYAVKLEEYRELVDDMKDESCDFAMGMHYCKQKEHLLAFPYFLRVLEVSSITNARLYIIRIINAYLTANFDYRVAYKCRMWLDNRNTYKLQRYINKHMWIKEVEGITKEECCICYETEFMAYATCRCTKIKYCCECVRKEKRCPTCRTTFDVKSG